MQVKFIAQSVTERVTAITERVFSEVNNAWKTEATQLKIDTLKAILFVKFNLDYTCTEFYDMLLTNTLVN